MTTRSRAMIVHDCRRVLHLNNRELAEFLGVSVRTIQRHMSMGGVAYDSECEKLIHAVHPRNPALAAEFAEHIGKTLPSLGLAAPHDPRRAPAQPVLSRLYADAVVCAAADALGQPPAAVRKAVAAAFRRALDLGASLEELTWLLASEGELPPRTGEPVSGWVAKRDQGS